MTEVRFQLINDELHTLVLDKTMDETLDYLARFYDERGCFEMYNGDTFTLEDILFHSIQEGDEYMVFKSEDGEFKLVSSSL